MIDNKYVGTGIITQIDDFYEDGMRGPIAAISFLAVVEINQISWTICGDSIHSRIDAGPRWLCLDSLTSSA